MGLPLGLGREQVRKLRVDGGRAFERCLGESSPLDDKRDPGRRLLREEKLLVLLEFLRWIWGYGVNCWVCGSIKEKKENTYCWENVSCRHDFWKWKVTGSGSRK